MQVAVASDDGKTIARHFGRARGFLVYEIENSRIRNRRYVRNTFTGHAGNVEAGHDPADCHDSIIAALNDCEAVISHGMGKRIYRDLRKAGITAYVVDETDADAALSLYLRNALTDHPERGCAREA